ncbi:NAD(P)H-hydrate dehydratase [Niabella ginsengisoli]|uniref:ADP-dependent (S)-NAD(P)H-hydrate dehydratase n=1 Tax=Niabella ginsengisoli TaxID=522298 RepID=A0ABS9SKY1_9BACT|nr:NAD(P)H-hydrate dehydratase [Niabella ginsengisoli]MCH5598997.1 NAD(P)H-hydrate dehydratase [Niabella ginsengisoli]
MAYKKYLNKNFAIFCGPGNNGGDGLAIARLLSLSGHAVQVFLLNSASKRSSDFDINYKCLKEVASVIIDLKEISLPSLAADTIIIDAIFGTGLNRSLDGFSKQLVEYINRLNNKVVAIDMPSGLLTDLSSKGLTAIKANNTLTFQCFKAAFLLPENEEYFGNVHILDINLHPSYLNSVETTFELVDQQFISSIIKLRKAFSHKGNFGHALIIAGSYGKMGAAVLSTKACLQSGAGLVTAHVPAKGVEIMQISAPEAMCRIDTQSEIISNIDYDLKPYTSIGIGPGIGKEKMTTSFLYQLLKDYQKPMVIDADALNILSENPDWLSLLPPGSILTPHPKEYARLFGNDMNDLEKINTALQKAHDLKIIIILKGHHTFIATPDGKGYFNTTGNAGMAKGGSGDVLTGIITGILAQGYKPNEAAILGVYMHGAAGDNAAAKYGMISMTATDLIEALKTPDLLTK